VPTLTEKASRSLAWLWLLVAVQVAIPASYYLRGHDPDDERFAWRMFSNVRLKRCSVRVFTVGAAGERREVRLPGSLHSSWINALERGRVRVIEHYLASQCSLQVGTTFLDRRCEDVRSSATPAQRYVYRCQAQRLSLRGEP
jgi:hypothetical protein